MNIDKCIPGETSVFAVIHLIQCNSQIRHQDDLLVLAFQIMAKCPRPSKYEWNMNSPQVCQPSKQDLATH